MAVYASVDKSCSVMPDRLIWNISLQGNQAEADDFIADISIGEDDENVVTRSDVLASIVTGASLSRTNGGIVNCSKQVTQLLKAEVWGIESQEMSKDVRTYLATLESGAALQADLVAISAWEQMRDLNNITEYTNFQYVGMDGVPHELSTNAKKVAEKILRGIESYSLFYPVLTCTSTWGGSGGYSPIGTIGQIGTPTARAGYSELGLAPSSVTSMTDYWLKNMERLTPNGDGTCTLLEGWVGLDGYDADLYQTSGSGS